MTKPKDGFSAPSILLEAFFPGTGQRQKPREGSEPEQVHPYPQKGRVGSWKKAKTLSVMKRSGSSKRRGAVGSQKLVFKNSCLDRCDGDMQ